MGFVTKWPIVKFQDLLDGKLLNGPHQKDMEFGKGNPIVRMVDLYRGDIIKVSSLDRVIYPKKPNREYLLSDGDILLNRTSLKRDGVGKSCLVPELDEDTYFDCSVIRARLNKYVANPKYVNYVMSSNYVRRQIEAVAKTATITTIAQPEVNNLLLPLPPLKEQKRIAAILDKADSLRRKRQQAIQLADQFLRAVFLDMFGDPVTNPKGWDVKPLKEMAVVTTGNTPSRKNSEYYGNHIEWIKSDNINTPNDILTQATEYLSEEGKGVARTVPAGSTLVTCIAGSKDCVGNAAYTDREVAFNQQINALTPKSGVTSWFLYILVLRSKKLIQAASTNSMKGMVSKGNMEKIEFICPPEAEQEKFEILLRKYFKIKLDEESGRALAADIFSSLSHKAFSGDL